MSNFTVGEGLDTGQIFEFAKDFNDSDGNRSKLSPPDEIIQTGLKVGEPWARVWLNNAHFNHGQYLLWLTGEAVVEKEEGLFNEPTQVENFEPVGTVKTINQTQRDTWYGNLPNDTTPAGKMKTALGSAEFTEALASEYWGGTWVRDNTTPTAVTFTKTELSTYVP